MKVCRFCDAVLSDTDLICAKCGAAADSSGMTDDMADAEGINIMKDERQTYTMDDAYVQPTPAAQGVPVAQVQQQYNQGYVTPAQPVQSAQNSYTQQGYSQPYGQQTYAAPQQSHPQSTYIPAGSYVQPVSESDILKISDVLILAASGLIPIASIVLLIIWATGCCGRSRKNLAVAYLILYGILIVLAILVSIFFPMSNWW